jgi:hypothetical protein
MDLKVSKQHSFELTTFMSFTYCDICSKLLWGVSKQGYTCIKCGLNVHETCSHVPSLCVPNPEVIKAHALSKENLPNGSKTSFSSSSFIKNFQENNNKLMMEASQKLQNTRTLVKDKISQLNNQNEINQIIEKELKNSTNNDNKNRDIPISNEILKETNSTFTGKINENTSDKKNSTDPQKNDIIKAKLELLSDDEYSSNISDVSKKKNKKKKLHKKKGTSDSREIFSDSEKILNDSDENDNTNSLRKFKRNVSSGDVKESLIFSEPEELSYKNSSSSKLFKRRKHKSSNKEDESSINDNDISSNKEESGNRKSSLKFFSRKKNSSIDDDSSTEVVLNLSEEKITDEDNNNVINSTKIENPNPSVPSLLNFNKSNLKEIIKEPSTQNDEDEIKKSLKSKPSQSEICAYSIVVTSNNKSSSVESDLTDLEPNEKDKEKDKDRDKDKNKKKNNNKEKESNNNESPKEKKNSIVSFKIDKKNNSEPNPERKKEYLQNNKKSKSMAALMKTNQVHSKLEQLLKSDTFSFQNKITESENEPLSLFSTTPKNTIVFATKIGPVFDLQDKFMDIIHWKNPSRSFSAYLIYSIFCFKPNLILYIPVISVVLFLAYFYYKRETGNNNIKSEKEKKSSKKEKEKEKEKEREKNNDMLTNLNSLFSTLSIKQKAAFNPNMVDMKTLQGNIQRLQNMMGSYCSMYDSVIEIWEKFKSTEPLKIRKALFYALIGLLGQIVTLKFIRIGIIFFIVGTFAFFPQFSLFLVWVLTGWVKVVLEIINDIVTRIQNNKSNSKLYYLGKKLIKPIAEVYSDSEDMEYSVNTQRARLYSTIENNELKVQKSVDSKSSFDKGISQNIMEGKIFTAIVVENQRWWVGTGFTDLLLNKDPPNYSTNYKEPKEALPSSLDNYPLPPNYRFIPNKSWEIEMDHGDEEGWIYMDNVWKNEGPRKISSYTRKRIWKRTATFYS